MADSHFAHSTDQSSSPSPTPAQSTQSYEGFDPELPEHDEKTGKTAKVSSVQIGASAAAAVTSALAASFFGVAGTLIGAAVGSIVSTIAGALYADYMRRAGQRLRGTTTVVVQRIPPEKLAASPLRRLAEPTNPAGLPAGRTLRPVTARAGEETVVVPLTPGTEILVTPDRDPGTIVLDGSTLAPRGQDDTRLMPAVPASVPLGGGGPTGPAGRGPQAGEPDPRYPEAGDGEPSPRSWWRRPVVGMVAVGLAGFGIALGMITLSEGLLGHPISGGTGGTTLGTVGHPKAASTPTRTSTVTVTETASPEASATSTPEVTTTTQPQPSVTGAPSATAPSATQPASPTATAPATSNDLNLQPTP